MTILEKFLSPEAEATLWMWIFGTFKVPMIGYVRPRIINVTDDQLIVKIRLRRRTKNHLHSMYFAALALGADVTGGFLAVNKIRKLKAKVSFVFKDLHADFLKRADGDVHFRTDDGFALIKLVEEAIKTGERVFLPVNIVATVPDKYGDEPVAKFVTTLSLKKYG